MLSAIQHVLNEVCELANARYPEGGLSYSYSYFHNTAHCNLDESIEYDFNLTERKYYINERILDVNEIEALSSLIERSINDVNAEVISLKALEYTSILVNTLNKYLMGNFTKIVLNIYEGCYHNIIIESVNNSNCGQRLDIFWSID